MCSASTPLFRRIWASGEFLYRDLFHSATEIYTKSGRGGRVVDVGWLSAAQTLLLIGGSVGGGCGVYALIRSHPYCRKCQRFMKIRTKQVRYLRTKSEVTRVRDQMQVFCAGEDEVLLEALLRHHTELTKEKNINERSWRSILWHKERTGCGADCLEHRGYRFGRRGWEEQIDRSQLYPTQQIQIEP